MKEYLLKIINSKGFENEDTLWFAAVMEQGYSEQALEEAFKIASMSLEEKIEKVM